jgi:hypothetical protein
VEPFLLGSIREKEGSVTVNNDRHVNDVTDSTLIDGLNRASIRSVSKSTQRRSYRVLWLVVPLAVALISAEACSDNKSPTAPSTVVSAQSATVDGGPAGSGVTSPVTSPPSGQGELTFTPPAGVPTDGGCISVNAITTPTLDWVVQAMPDHANTIQMGGTFIHEPTAGCDTTNHDDLARPVALTGPHLTYAPGETGASTLSWSTDRCKDGGHFEIEVWALREVPSETESDRLSSVTTVDCGFPTPAGQQ